MRFPRIPVLLGQGVVKDKTKSTKERIEQCREEAPQTWISSRDGRTDYYDLILRDKWKTKK